MHTTGRKLLPSNLREPKTYLGIARRERLSVLFPDPKHILKRDRNVQLPHQAVHKVVNGELSRLPTGGTPPIGGNAAFANSVVTDVGSVCAVEHVFADWADVRGDHI